jgi:hypothetical protein
VRRYRVEDGALATVIEQGLVLAYTCVLLIKTCDLSVDVCSTYGFGDTASGEEVLLKLVTRHYLSLLSLPDCVWEMPRCVHVGVYLFFVFFALGMLVILLVVGATRLFYAGYVPKVVLVATSHSIGVSQIAKKILRRRSRNISLHAHCFNRLAQN